VRRYEATAYIENEGAGDLKTLARELDAVAREQAREHDDIFVGEVRCAPSISSVVITLEVVAERPSHAARMSSNFLNDVVGRMGSRVLVGAGRELAYA